MRSGILVLVIAAAIALCGCRAAEATASAQTKGPNWATGFWFWGGSSAAVTASTTADVLYVQAGKIYRGGWGERQAWGVSMDTSVDRLPPAREYWFVVRSDEPGLPDPEIAAPLIANTAELLRDAKRQNLPVTGIQLDIDSPTASLSRYGALLAEVRKQLPAGTKLSITALLDWFRDGTAVAQVVKHVDEFVPQFYDTGDRYRGEVIAATVNPTVWGPLFQRTGKPYRIGVSSFGRLRHLPRNSTVPQTWGISVISDLTPLEVAMNPDFGRAISTTPAKETVVRYEATRKTKIAWSEIEPGEQFEFIFPTPESMAAAVRGAKAMGSRCTGVVFFRWPSFRETMAAQPDQVLRAAGVLAKLEGTSVKLHTIDRECSTVHCTDLFVTDAEPLLPRPLRYEIRSSAPLEYVVPADKMPVRMSGIHTVELSLPAFTGRSRIYLGRAVTINKVEFRLAEVDR
jgi:hypothetical protein